MKAKLIKEGSLMNELPDVDLQLEIYQALIQRGFNNTYANELAENILKSLSAHRRPKDEVLLDFKDLGNALIQIADYLKR